MNSMFLYCEYECACQRLATLSSDEIAGGMMKLHYFLFRRVTGSWARSCPVRVCTIAVIELLRVGWGTIRHWSVLIVKT